MGPTALLVNFYLYLQYFQQKVFSFSISKINRSQTDPFFLLYFFSPLTHSLLSSLFSILLHLIKVSLILKGSSIMIFCYDLSGSSRSETDQRECERGTEMGFLRWVWWFLTMGAKVVGFVFIFCSGVVVLVWVFFVKGNVKICWFYWKAGVLGGVVEGDSTRLQKEVL